MPSAFTHAVAAATLGALIVPGRGRLMALGVACAIAPDLDVLSFALGVPYHGLLGHRGITHSVLFAAVLAAAAAWVAARWERRVSVIRLDLFLFLATVSHGLLDALTDGGLGVAFFAPLSEARYFFPWRPMVVSPISARRFFSGEGLPVIASELVVVWIPAIVLWLIAVALRRRGQKRAGLGARRAGLDTDGRHP